MPRGVRSVALLPSIAVLAGVWAGIGIERPLLHGEACLVAVWIAAVVAWATRHGRAALLATTLGYAIAGVALGSDAAARALAPSIRATLEREVGGFALTTSGPALPHEPFTIRARLVEDASTVDALVSMRVELEAIVIRGVVQPVAGGVRLAVSGAAAAGKAGEWRAGRTIHAPVTFRRPGRYLNDGVPDFEHDLALDGIALNAAAKSALLVEVVRHGNAFEEAAADVRAYVRTHVRRDVAARDPLAGAIVTAILIGDRSGLPAEVRSRLQAAGTYHVIAISGGNIAILAALIAGVFLVTGGIGRSSAVTIIAVLLAYAAVVNAGPSVWRATGTAVAYLAARVLDHRSPPWNAMAVSALLLACLAPLDVRDVGFALTFGATAAILEAAHRVRPGGRDAHGRAAIWRSWMIASVVASAAAEVVLLPITASAFSRVTFAGLVLNLLAVPLMTVAQVAGLIVVTLGGVESLASVAGWVAAGAARLLVDSARLIDILPWLAVRVPAPSPVVSVSYYLALGAAFWLPNTRGSDVPLHFLPARARSAKAGCAVTTATCALLILTGATPAVRPHAPDGRLRLTVFDVGQGDALLLQTPAGRALMVDTGGAGFDGHAFDIGGRVLAPALWARGVRRLEVLALTHGDPDHIGGATAILRDFAPSGIWQGIPVPRHAPLQAVLARARDAGIPVMQETVGAGLDIDGVSIRVLHPSPADWERPRVRNDDSLVLEVRYGQTAMLLTGDVGAEIERAILPTLTPARVRLLKVAHHGSRTSTSQELLDAWKPHIAVISCGRGNRFGHPVPEVIDRLERSSARIYRTDRNGQITIDTDGDSMAVKTFTGEKP